MDRVSILQELFAAFPNITATAATFAVYTKVLASIPLVELEVVVSQILSEPLKFPPTPGEILEKYRLMRGIGETGNAAQGWLSVQRGMAGTYAPEVPKFKDPIVAKVVEAMGMHNLRMSEQPRIDQAQFFKLYEAFANAETESKRLTAEFRELKDMFKEGHSGDPKQLEG